MESELERHRALIHALNAQNAALSEENDVLKAFRSDEERRRVKEQRCREILEAEGEALEDEDFQHRLMALLSSVGVRQEWIPSLQTELQKLFTVSTTSTRIQRIV